MSLERAQAKIKRWRQYPDGPLQFVRENFKVEPDPWQRTGLRLLASPDPRAQRIAMKACKGPGKTAFLAWAIWWFMICRAFRGNHPKGAATSITQANIDDNLWPELAKWRNRSGFIREAFTWTKSRIQANGFEETWWFSKRTWSRSADPQELANTLAGLHADNIMAVLDESGGIPSSVMATADAILTAPWGKILQAGNPTHLEGPLYDACTAHADLWSVIEITGDPDDPNRSSRIPKEWARQQIQMYGADNPWVLVNVFGRFPPASLNSILGPDEVKEAMHRKLDLDAYLHFQKRLGVDVARFGDDRTVLFPRQGLHTLKPIIMRGERTTMIAGRILLAKERWNWEIALVDDTGHWGHGVIDNLMAVGAPAIGVQFHGPALDNRYKNRRAEGWLKMAEWVRRGGQLPKIPELVAELTTPTYHFAGGQFQLEEKDIIKKRLGRSPDLADALALTFMLPELPHNPDLPLGHPKYERAVFGASTRTPDWDPLSDERINA